MENKLVVFKGKEIRRTLYNGEWMFAVEDICGALMDMPDGNTCWRELKGRLRTEGYDVTTLCHSLAFLEPGGKSRRTDCADLEAIFRIVQSIASPRAEVFKRWLAMAGWQGKKPQNHHTDLDSIFTMLGEAATTEIARKQKVQGFSENKTAARKGGRISGDARKKLEAETGDKVVSSENYLTEPESRKRLKR